METTRIRIGVMQAVIILLALIAAGIHLSLLFPDVIFILNGLGYLGLTAAYFLQLPIPFLQDRKRLVRFALIGYTALTLILWLAIGEQTPLGIFTAAVELLLIVLLLFQRP
ncbi:MAG: hypothetical protein D9V45_12735 [Chloroflexi bacterium]|nr:MAG: hypothetical protein D9V45_12735 [Chloroflexota bacterium]